MSHFRYDVTTHDWVIFAPERAHRPHDFPIRLEGSENPLTCPFCPGHTAEPDPSVLTIQDPDSPGAWSVRVVGNKYPALNEAACAGFVERGRHFQEFDGFGAHEVIIESPDHSLPLASQPLPQVERILTALQIRYRALSRDVRLRAIILFKNHGARAGTSLRHPHWQIIATPLVPHLLRQKHAIALDYFDHAFKCLHTVLLKEEMDNGTRVLAENESFAAFLPFASHRAYQIRILPKAYQASFSDCSQRQLAHLAAILKTVLGCLHALLGDPAFNLTLVSAPLGEKNEEFFQWHIDILPRLFTAAGFELGSGMSINPILPEAATAELRKACGLA